MLCLFIRGEEVLKNKNKNVHFYLLAAIPNIVYNNEY